MNAFVKRYFRVELVLLAAQLLGIGTMSLLFYTWGFEVERVVGTFNKLPLLTVQLHRHHTLVFGSTAGFLLLLYAICFHRFDRVTAGRRFVVLSLAVLIVLACVSALGGLLAWDAIYQQSIKSHWNTGEKA